MPEGMEGPYAHKDIALHFCNWFEPVFYVYMIKAFQQLIEEKYNAQSLEWHLGKITDNVEEVRIFWIPFLVKNQNEIALN